MPFGGSSPKKEGYQQVLLHDDEETDEVRANIKNCPSSTTVWPEFQVRDRKSARGRQLAAR